MNTIYNVIPSLVCDKVAPKYVESYPANGATDVEVNIKNICFSFSEAMGPAFSVKWQGAEQGLIANEGNWVSPRTVCFSVNSTLPPNNPVYWTLNDESSQSSFADLAGNLLKTTGGYFVSGGNDQAAGWPMAYYNPQRTNQSEASGPQVLPTFVSVAENVSTLWRIGYGGDLILSDSSTVYCLTSNGVLKWSTYIGFIKDIAVGPSNNIYVVSECYKHAMISHLDGSSIWPEPFITRSDAWGCSSLTITSDETVLFRIDSPFNLYTQIATIFAINKNGTINWEYTTDYLGYGGGVNNNEDIVYYTNAAAKPIALSLTTGELVGWSKYDQGFILGYAPWEILYVAQDYITQNYSKHTLVSFSEDLTGVKYDDVEYTFADRVAITMNGYLVIATGSFPEGILTYNTFCIDSSGHTIWVKNSYTEG